MEDLPSGTVTLLFTDVEGSTPLVQALGAAYQEVLAEHRELLRDSVASHAGREVDCRADDFLACFPRASDALAAAIAAQMALTSQNSQLRVRMGLHTGEPELIGDAYIGIDVNRAARICSAGHGGQILVSQTTRDLVSTGVQFRDLGTYLLAGVEQAERIFEVRAPGLRAASLPLRAERATGVHHRRRPGEVTTLTHYAHLFDEQRLGTAKPMVDAITEARRDVRNLYAPAAPRRLRQAAPAAVRRKAKR
jgi:class 3 adenylate cyclase